MVARYSGSENKAGNVMGIIFLFLHLTFYATFVDVTSYVYCSEIFPTNQRAQGVALSIFGLFMTTLSKSSLPLCVLAMSTDNM